MSPGGIATIDVVLFAADRGLSGFDVVISVMDEGLMQIIKVEFPNLGLAASTDLPASQVRLRAVDLNELIPPGTVVARLATLKFQTNGHTGSTLVRLSVTAMDDDDGNPVAPRVSDGLVEVS